MNQTFAQTGTWTVHASPDGSKYIATITLLPPRTRTYLRRIEQIVFPYTTDDTSDWRKVTSYTADGTATVIRDDQTDATTVA